ncbi:MAG: 2,3-bisphosphoglycerate-independent phosphoglycerate mutase [Epsilonproteobacteria bacterium]|nr:2,3-bisphosphoglycerate-independent phosphoglycerate mutase [Campylobacterota bacterium]MBD3839497.1 2,3-bisphosphoglycerate-independent phosphoglycerate mutase [Campylobacterota bacterium]
MKIQKTLLVITDGIGYKPDSVCNAFDGAIKPTYDRLLAQTPKTLISTHGLSVGLPKGQMGNSEVGHMSIGSGRVLYQDLVKISLAIDDGSIYENRALNKLLNLTSRVHIIGLLSDGGVHSHIEHIMGLAKVIASNKKRVFLHLITDGRDVSPTSAIGFIEQIEAICDEKISIATVAGRFYTMDRDNRWERVQKGYNAMVLAFPSSQESIKAYITQNYEKNITDEFIEPMAFNDYEGMMDNDGIIMANFRSDRAREITTALGVKSFDKFKTSQFTFNIITLTKYDNAFDFDIMFEKQIPKNTLAEVISNANLKQLHTAETEKYAHVTFFLNGGVEVPYVGESRVLIPSPNVKTYDLLPEMSSVEVGEAVLKGMDEAYDFIVVNFANGDMVGHTGNYEAGVKAVEAVDKQLGKIMAKAKEKDYAVVITSDHGNCEEMRNAHGEVLTNHTIGDVWCFVEACHVKELKEGCGLNNIAPTILKIMGLEIPSEMDEALF